MLAKFLENLTGRLPVGQNYSWAGRLSSRPEFRRKIEGPGSSTNLDCTGEVIVYLAGQVSQVLGDIALLREAGYDVQVGMDGCLSGVVFVVDLDTFMSRDALERMLSLIRSNTSGARVVIRTATMSVPECRRIVDRFGELLVPDETMKNVADILDGHIMFVGFHGKSSIDVYAPPIRVVS